MIQLTTEQLQYFKEVFNFDARVVSIYNKPLDEKSIGEYDWNNPGVVFIDMAKIDQLQPIHFHTTLVHEITHLLQFEQKKTLSLDFTYHNAYEFGQHCAFMKWCEKPIEIDAVLSELYFMWKYNGNDRIEHLIDYCERRFENNESYNVSVCVNLMRDKGLVPQEYVKFIVDILKGLDKYKS